MFSAAHTELLATYVVFSKILVFLWGGVYVWMPLLMGAIFIKVWLQYIRYEYMLHQGSFLIEVKLPREILKTPLAMETFLHALWQKPSSTYIDTYWNGKIQPWFSLELVSI